MVGGKQEISQRRMSMTFGEALQRVRRKAGKSRYKLAQWCGINEAYVLRLENGERNNPSRDVVLMLALALVHNSPLLDFYDIDGLLMAAGYAPLRRRGETSTGLPRSEDGYGSSVAPAPSPGR